MTSQIETSPPISLQPESLPEIPPKAENLTEKVKRELRDYCEGKQREINHHHRIWVNAATLLVAVSVGIVAGCLLGGSFWGLLLGTIIGATVLTPLVEHIGSKLKDRTYQLASEALDKGRLQEFAEKMKIPLNIHTVHLVHKLHVDYLLSLVTKSRAELKI